MAAVRTGVIQIRALAGQPLSRGQALRAAALGAVVLLAGILRFADLGSLGYVNHYYSAATTAMLASWHNFFFAAAEPGAAVTVDKPPAGLWLQAASAYVFGVDTFGVLLPQLLAGMLSVLVVHHLVRRRFGYLAGLAAALALAITPVAVAVDRNNTIDSTLILTLLLAAWAFVKATEEGKLKYLLLGAGLVGLGFNIKMLQAFLPLPAFYALYFLGSREGLLRKIGRLALATVLLAVVSLSWVTIVDLTPAGQRPYVGSSGDNTETSLIVGYNGLMRLMGRGGGGLFQQPGTRGGAPGQWNRPASRSASQAGTGGGRVNAIQPVSLANDGQPAGAGATGGAGSGQGGGRPAGGPGGGGGPPAGGFGGGQGAPGGGSPSSSAAAGFSQIGQTGPLRLFRAPLSKEASWLLPFGLGGALLLALRRRPRWPVAPEHQALLLWGGWLLTAGAFFSVASFYHEYYLAMIAAPLAALVGIGVGELWRLAEKHPWPALAALLAAGAPTLALQYATARAFVKSIWWEPIVIVLLAAGLALTLLAQGRRGRLAMVGFACLVAALAVTPALWSWLTTLNPGVNQSLPASYDGDATPPGALAGLKVDQELLAYLQERTQSTKYLVAVPSSMQGSDYVIATRRPVLYLGGFMGQDSVESADSLAQMVARGELRFVYTTSQRGRGPGGDQGEVSSWVASACHAVEGFDTQTRNTGAPGGTTRSADGSAAQGFGGMQITLYDCGGASS